MNNHTPFSNNFYSVKRYPFYFGSKEKPLLGWLHTTSAQQHSSTGIIICPPLAVEYMNSYRSLRYIADYFALAGIPAIRFDYHGTGDSSGIEEDDNRLDNWLWSINQAIEQLKTLTGCEKFGLFGFRMGATLASLVAKTTPTEFLILWAALDSGKKYIREIKLLQMTSKIQPNNQNESLLEAGGMGYWAQTADDLGKINLTKMTPQAKRILIVPRDEQATDTKLLQAWKQHDLNIEQINDVGSAQMLVDAHQTIVPHQAIQNVIQWVQKDLDKNTISNPIQSIQQKIARYADITHINGCSSTSQENQTVRESIFYYGADNQHFAILTETEKSKKSALPTVIIANSGANHRVGPSRLYVLIARELSLMGFRCLRVDVPGIGDSIAPNQELENIEYITSSSKRILEVIEALQCNSNSQFILMGLCSGAYFSFHAALDLTKINITESILINPLTFYWDEGMSEHNSPTKHFSTWNWYKKALASPNSWIKLLKGKIDFKSLFQAVKNRVEIRLMSKLSHITQNETVKNANKHRHQLGLDLAKIANNNTHIQFILARNDPGYDILMTNAGKTVKKLQKTNKINIAFVENADHTFSKYKPRCKTIHTLVQLLKDRYHLPPKNNNF
ncbi:hypothetical protein MNBD_GAMMA23-344 [hydrothermal vent metagenome]|uniref:Uncharacterized protein n=1 Tax=hydrothermal vent metagenome TaxID=652676 RepID=A0A3B0ZH09_9ZZZZ